MHLRRKAGACLLASTVVFAGIVPATSAGADTIGEATQRGTRPAAAARTVTLITGDRVTVPEAGSDQVTIDRGPGRTNVRFITSTEKGELYVVPVDALAMLNAGRLDRQLFNVTALVKYGYDDRRANLPLIVTHNSPVAARSAVSVTGAKVVRDLSSIAGVAVQQNRRDATAFWNQVTGGAGAKVRALGHGLTMMWLDAVVQPTLDVSVPQIGAPAAWQAGYTGEGVTVAVVDTGIDPAHPDLADRVAARRNFTEGEDDLDRVGHGTHVASTIAGTGAASGGKYKGAAPGARLLDSKVCSAQLGCQFSWIVAGMQWAAEQRAKVVNVSLGGPDQPGLDPMELAVQNLTEQHGTLFVVATGNDGADRTINSPSSADAALSVGAVTKADALAPFSSRGPRNFDSALKPDITGPGVGIVAARSKDGFLGSPGEQYMPLNGTSMATPHVAGAAAILAQRRPDWSSSVLKSALMGAAKPNPAIGVFGQGAGRVDAARAINQTVTTTPASLSFGQQRWPHHDDTPMAKTVTYRNHGTAAVTLDLKFDTRGPDGKPTPAGLFTVNTQQITVPAGGEATVTVTADTRVAGPDGFVGGNLTATAGALTVQTPLAVDKEVESYDLTVTYTNRAGAASDLYSSYLINLDRPEFFRLFDADGTVDMRLPKGRYVLFANIFEGNEPDSPVTQLVQPELNLTGRQSVALDARLGKPVSVKVPRADAKSLVAAVGVTAKVGAELPSAGIVAENLDGLYTARVGPDTGPVRGFTAMIASQWAAAKPDGTVDDSPYAYRLSFYEKGVMPTGYHRAVADRDLAAVRADSAVATADAIGGFGAVSRLPGRFDVSFAARVPFRLPLTRTEYYNVDQGVQWKNIFTEQRGDEAFTSSVGPWTNYRAGRNPDEQWNRGVFGPAFPKPDVPPLWTTRIGNTMLVNIPMYSAPGPRSGFSSDVGRTTLFRDGVKVGESPYPAYGEFPVPAAAGQYRLEVDSERPPPFSLSTRNTAVWTFRSGPAPEDSFVPLPLSAVRFAPRLDAQNTAPANRAFLVPVSFERHPGSSAGNRRSLNVDVSYDDGRTWQPVRLLGGPHGGATAVLRHPAGAGYVSLRAKATDTAGNSVEQTIVHAYRYA